MTRWRDFLRPPSADGGEASEQASTAYVLLLAGTGLLAFASLVSFALRPLPLSGHIAYVLMLAAHVLTLALIRRRIVRGAIIGFTVAYLAVVATAVARSGGQLAPTGFVLPPLVIFVGLTLGGRSALVTSLGASAMVLALVGLDRGGYLPEVTTTFAPIRVWLVASVALVITGIMLHAALRIIRESRARAAAEEATRRVMEERLMQSRRLETVGRLAAGVAHDFNNVLTVVFAEVSRLQRGDEKTRASATNIKDAAEHAAALTRQLMSFGRQQVRRPERLDLAQVTAQLERLLGKFVGEHIQLAIKPGADVPAVLADRTEVEQVLLNLVTNARDAMPDGGSLTVRTGVATAAMRARCPEVAGAAAAFLSVTDTGIGIPADVRARLFEPFYTTKEIGKGTGLGLATVQAIAGNSGGAVLVDSEPGQGATFTVVLPPE
jgi:signal transduction histidine kinase